MKRHAICAIAVPIIAFACAAPHASLTATRTDEGIGISEGDSNVLFYQVKPKSLHGKFERAGYVHPLYSLKGNVITEDFPKDHYHHHGIYFAWHQILLDGQRIGDGWTSDHISFEVVDAQLSKKGRNLAINSEVLWKSMWDGQHPEIIAKERLKINVHPSKNAQFRMIDFDMTLIPMKTGLAIGGSEDEKGYGGFSLRLMLPEDIEFVSEGQHVEPKVTSVKTGPWMNFTGSFDGEAAPPTGVLVFNHPSNPGSPQPWILRKEKSMQNVAFPGRHPVLLEADGLTLRYRVVVCREVLLTSLVEDLYQQYAAD